MGRRSIANGVSPKGISRIQFDFVVDGVRFRPSLPWSPTPSNLDRARKLNTRIKAQIELGTFVFSEVFPKFRGIQSLPAQVSARSCEEIFEEFLRHEEARVARDDLAPVTLRSHRQILNHVWRPKLGKLPFLAVQYSTIVKIADSHSWNKKPTTTALARCVAPSRLVTWTTPTNAILQPIFAARASARRIAPRSIRSAFRMPKY
jgi:hypothetical protein